MLALENKPTIKLTGEKKFYALMKHCIENLNFQNYM